jgi:hypothetical protein
MVVKVAIVATLFAVFSVFLAVEFMVYFFTIGAL